MHGTGQIVKRISARNWQQHEIVHHSDHVSPLVRVACTRPLVPPWPVAAGMAARFAAAARPMPTIFRTPMVAHALSAKVPAPARLRSLVAALHGRLSVVNGTNAVRLPAGLVAAIHGLLRAGFDGSALLAKDAWDGGGLNPHARRYSRVRRAADARGGYELRMTRAFLNALPPSTRELLGGDVAWAALALYESPAPVVRLTGSGGNDATNRAANAVAIAEIAYRLAIIAGRGAADDWTALDRIAIVAGASPWPARHPAVRDAGQGPGAHRRDGDRVRPWFVAPLLVPDAWLAAHADPETLAHWARLTGRSGTPDRYWFPETWDRFLEPGRRVGWLTANDVWRPRRGRLASASSSADPDAPHDDHPLTPRHGGLTLTPDLERGVGVPPGYALVRCAGTLDVAVVVTP